MSMEEFFQKTTADYIMDVVFCVAGISVFLLLPFGLIMTLSQENNSIEEKEKLKKEADAFIIKHLPDSAKIEYLQK